MGHLILLDQDSVLADFERGAHDAWQQRYGEAMPVAQPRRHFYLRDDLPEKAQAQWQSLYRSAGFFASLPPVEGAIAAAQQLLAAGNDVRICTSPILDYAHCVREKFDWVAQHLGGDWVERIILTRDKTWVRGDVLIDDKPEISGSLKPVWRHVVYDQSYNRHIRAERVRWADKDSWAQWL